MSVFLNIIVRKAFKKLTKGVRYVSNFSDAPGNRNREHLYFSTCFSWTSPLTGNRLGNILLDLRLRLSPVANTTINFLDDSPARKAVSHSQKERSNLDCLIFQTTALDSGKIFFSRPLLGMMEGVSSKKDIPFIHKAIFKDLLDKYAGSSNN